MRGRLKPQDGAHSKPWDAGQSSSQYTPGVAPGAGAKASASNLTVTLAQNRQELTPCHNIERSLALAVFRGKGAGVIVMLKSIQ